uniref:Uncharacterized protein n=1 Tax=Anopheles minimus TaxID=112268 RepID=A0A182WN41_9DIPT
SCSLVASCRQHPHFRCLEARSNLRQFQLQWWWSRRLVELTGETHRQKTP